MWIRPLYPPQARMPSMRPQPTATARVEIKPKPAAVPAKSVKATPPPDPIRSDDDESEAGGFHESSYELKTGLDMLETDWPDDTTIPGALGDH